MERRLRYVFSEKNRQSSKCAILLHAYSSASLTFVEKIEVDRKRVFGFRKTFIHLLIFCAF